MAMLGLCASLVEEGYFDQRFVQSMICAKGSGIMNLLILEPQLLVAVPLVIVE